MLFVSSWSTVLSEFEKGKFFNTLISDLLVKKLDSEKELSYNNTETDFVDYDGMGNQGRFPKEK